MNVYERMNLPMCVVEGASFHTFTSMLTSVVFSAILLSFSEKNFFAEFQRQTIHSRVVVGIKQREDLLGCGLCKRHFKQVTW